jgi:Rhodopirellula transposase DDE domain
LNWRGRPLTSHEVVVQTIAATRTSSGLHVEAALDSGDYPTGVAISKERMAALPLERHATHGAWNYTLHPGHASGPAQTAPASESRGPAQRRQSVLTKLADPRLTGMSTAQLQQLAAALAPAQAARAQQRYSEQRGGRARRARGNPRGRPLFDDAARLLLTLLYQRQVCSMNVLADLLEVTATYIGDLVKQTREILEDHGHDPGVAPVRFTTADALLSFLRTDLRPARAVIIERLSHPALTGLTRNQLHELTSRLAIRQSAQAERLSYQRRGGPRQPGTRGGVFHQKISNSERVLLASSTTEDCAPWMSSPTPSATSAEPPSATSSAKPCPCSSTKTASPGPYQPATAQPRISSPPQQRTTRRQVDSLRLQCTRHRCQAAPGSVAPIASVRPR